MAAATLTQILTEYNYNTGYEYYTRCHSAIEGKPTKNENINIFRTTEEIQSGELQWPFWTKLVVVAIGFTGMILSKLLQLSNKLL